MTTPVTLNVTNWGFYDDDAGEAASNELTINVDPTKGDLDYDVSYQFRIDCYESNGGASKNTALQLRYRHKPSGGAFGSWAEVNATSSYVRSSQQASSNLTDGGDTAGNRLGGSFTYDNTNGAQDTDDGLAGDGDADFTSTGAEYVFAFVIRSADVSEDDTIELDVTVDPIPDTQNWPSAWPSYIAPAGVTHYTLPAGNTSITVTGTANDLDADRKLVAGTNNLPVTGTATAFIRGRILDAATNSLSVTGTANDLDADRKLAAGTNSLSITGTAVALTYAPVAAGAVYPVEDVLLREPNLWVPRKKPIGSVKIDWSNPITRKLAFYLPYTEGASYPRDLVTGKSAELATNVPTWAVDADGKAIFHTNTGDGIKFTGFALTNTRTYSTRVSGQLNNYAPSGTINTTSGASGYMEFESDTSCRVGGVVTATTSFAHADGNFHQWTFWANNVTARRGVYVDGKSIADLSGNSNDYTGDIFIGRYSTAGNWDWDGNIHSFAIWDRELSSSEVFSLDRDPFQILIPA